MNKLKVMREQVKKELGYIQRGNLLQNELRMFYWVLRMRSLGKKAKGNATKKDILEKSIETIKKDSPDFDPQFDRNFFKA